MTLAEPNSRFRPSLHIMSPAAASLQSSEPVLARAAAIRGPSAWGESTGQVTKCVVLRIKQVDLVQQGTSDDETPVMRDRSRHVQEKGGLCFPFCRSAEELGDR